MNAVAFLLWFENLAADHLIIVVVGYTVVFLSLTLLSIVFYNIPRLLHLRKVLKNFREKKAHLPGAEVKKDESITGEETAAVSMAIFLFIGELHDEENTVLTIKKISRRYSPWNSKIYSVTRGLNKRF